MTTSRASKRSIKWPASTPPVPEPTKNRPLARLATVTGNPRSLTNASSSTEML
jgi:hypothetical protein